MFACGIPTVAPEKPVKLISWNTNARRHVQCSASIKESAAIDNGARSRPNEEPESTICI